MPRAALDEVTALADQEPRLAAERRHRLSSIAKLQNSQSFTGMLAHPKQHASTRQPLAAAQRC